MACLRYCPTHFYCMGAFVNGGTAFFPFLEKKQRRERQYGWSPDRKKNKPESFRVCLPRVRGMEHCDHLVDLEFDRGWSGNTDGLQIVKKTNLKVFGYAYLAFVAWN